MSKLNVVLCWHMHQPEYRDPDTGEFQQPWTYLHAIKDYVEMAAHIEAHPGARAVVNFVPILLEQLEDYRHQINQWRRDRKPLRDRLLAALADPGSCLDPVRRERILRDCLRANEERLIRRFEPFDELAAMAREFLDRPERIRYLSDRFVTDLTMWYHIAWLGETVRRSNPQVKAWIKQGRGFTEADRDAMVALIAELIGEVFTRYRRLSENGQVELSMTPYAHPIMPLLLDIKVTHESMPEADLPRATRYPEGRERTLWHLEHGRKVFEKFFGVEPAGCWPSEGAVSEATVRLLHQAGFDWAASGDSVLGNSLHRSDLAEPACRHRVYKYDGQDVSLFFRDDGLSDLIGFNYQSWHADDAVADFLGHLHSIAEHCSAEDAVVSIIMDGENAWEHYPHNGFWLLDKLYATLSTDPRIELITYGRVLESAPKRCKLPRLVAGSWVYGTLSTWIGDPDKNRGWDLLIEAKKAFDREVSAGRLKGERLERAIRQLAICEGSDWFWWFGDYNPAEAVSDFERLYRLHLARLYHLIDVIPPQTLEQVLSVGGGDPALGGVMRKGQ
ncbi:MAG: glycoside hydrolase [Halothiobacillaceae bacterium]